jgi:hypothetical protein
MLIEQSENAVCYGGNYPKKVYICNGPEVPGDEVEEEG